MTTAQVYNFHADCTFSFVALSIVDYKQVKIKYLTKNRLQWVLIFEFDTKKSFILFLCCCWSNAFVFIIIAPSPSFIQPTGSLGNPSLFLSCKCIQTTTTATTTTTTTTTNPRNTWTQLSRRQREVETWGEIYLFTGTETTTSITTRMIFVVWN